MMALSPSFGRVRAGLAVITAVVLATPAPARPLVREDFPAQALALSADADRDGFVTREELADACVKAVDGAEAEFTRDWEAKLRVYGMPAKSQALDLERIFAATVALVEAADADGDGRVTPAELKAYVGRFDAELRPDMIQAALALDGDADMVLTREELTLAKEAFAKELARYAALKPAEREPILHPSRAEALATWKASTLRIADAAVDLWRGVAGKSPRASLGDLRDQVQEDTDPPPKPRAPAP